MNRTKGKVPIIMNHRRNTASGFLLALLVDIKKKKMNCCS